MGINQQPFAKLCQVFVNPESSLKDSESINQFVSYLEPFLQPQSIQERLPPSDVVGNSRFSRKACFWDFTRHLDRLDAILITRLNDENTQGINAVLERKTVSTVYPQIGHFFANILDTGARQ